VVISKVCHKGGTDLVKTRWSGGYDSGL